MTINHKHILMGVFALAVGWYIGGHVGSYLKAVI
jgi:hypothetical protein